MPIYLLFFDKVEKYIESYEKHISIDTLNFKSAFVCSDVKELVKDYAVTFIVSPANSLGFMDGGIDMIYMEMFPGIQDRVKADIAKYNIKTSLGRNVLPIGSNIIVRTNDVNTPYLSCCPTMFLPGSIGEADNVYWAFVGLLQTLKHYTAVERLIVAIPCLGTGVGNMKPENSASQIQRAFNDFINNTVQYRSKILVDSPRGFVINKFESIQQLNYANTEIQNIEAERKKLKILSWNIWFDRYHFDERMNHIIEEIKENEPDIICFQEVTQFSLLHFENDEYIGFTYDAMYDSKVKSGYGDIILVKKTIKECFMAIEYYPETRMNRTITRVYLPYYECEICTTHLESIYKRGNVKYDENNIKHAQFRHLISSMKQSKANNVIIAGDFNIGEEDEHVFDGIIKHNSFEDVFDVIPDDRKCGVINTFDSAINKNIKEEFHSRLDRIYLRDPRLGVDSLVPFNYKVVGTTPFVSHESKTQVYPSDHFGILCTFTL